MNGELTIPGMTDVGIQQARRVEQLVAEMPQAIDTTEHQLHAGVYSRTVLIPKGVAACGALVKRSTNLVISGDILVTVGHVQRRYTGYATIAASANRKQTFYAFEDTYLTMYFSTESVTIEDAENEFTDEGALLMSRKPGSINHVTVTGE
jgi:hypothetical protein